MKPSKIAAAHAVRALPHGSGHDAWEIIVEKARKLLGRARGFGCGSRFRIKIRRAKCDARNVGRTMTMIDGQILIALAGAFLLGIVFGSGLEMLVRDGR